MGVILMNDVMQDVGYALLEDVVNTQLNPTGVNITPGVVTVTPGSMTGIYNGAQLVAGANGAANQEVITVSSTTATTFTATFVNNHPNTDSLTGSTFPKGQPDSPLYTQSEIMGYILGSEQDFMLRVRPVYATGTVNVTVGKRIYPAPADSIRVERAALINTAATPPTAAELYNTTQTDLDNLVTGWEAGSSSLTSWFQDQINTQTIGFGPTPQNGATVSLCYSQLHLGPVTPISQFLIPDAMTTAVKWRTLAKALSKDGETRDLQRAAFAQKLYDLLIIASQKFMAGVAARVRTEDETVEPLASQRM